MTCLALPGTSEGRFTGSSRTLVPILLYHTVATETTPLMRPFATDPETFNRHLDLLLEQGRTSLTVSGFLDAVAGTRPLPERPVVITFDDGFRDFADVALPALAGRGHVATLYVVTSLLRGRPGSRVAPGFGDRILDWSSLRELAAQGVEIGAHSHTHPQLDTLPRQLAREEIRLPKALLEEELQQEISSFAYPHGLFSPWIREETRRAGYASACAVKNASSSLDDDRFALSRFMVMAATSTSQLEAWLAGRDVRVAPRRESVRVRLWRAYRRTKTIARGRPTREIG